MIENRRLPAGHRLPADPLPSQELDAEAGGSPFELFQRLHRLLRGRYIITIVLAVIGAAAGAAAGYMSTEPLYRSTGLVRVLPMMPVVVTPTEQSRLHPLFTSFVQTQAAYLQTPRVIERAMESDAWRALGRPRTPAAKEAFIESLEVTAEREKPELIFVSFYDPDPKAARVASEQILRAYEHIYGATELIASEEHIAYLENLRRDLDSRIQQNNRRIHDMTKEYGTRDLGSLHASVIEQLQHAQGLLYDAEAQLNAARAAVEEAASRPDAAEVDPMSAAMAIGAVDQQMYGLLVEHAAAEANYERLRQQGFGENHRDVRRARARQDTAREAVVRYAEAYLERAGNLPAAAAAAANALPPERALDYAQHYYDTMAGQVSQIRSQAQRIDALRMEVAGVESQIQRDAEQLKAVQDRIAALNTESKALDLADVTGRITVISYGDDPTAPAVDHRKKLGALGFLAGAGLPVGAMILIGLLDGRYRYCDDARAGASRLPLLGILPDLPGNLTDPEQASIAAHCVHQVRTRLQISARDQGHQVFAVTSPTSGDGKTSLALSLGLSFAASGAETLLIDFDLIGAGLTAALQAGTDQGVVHALDAGGIDGHIVPGGFPRMSVLPAGMDDASQAGRLSPRMVRKIVDQARQHYDVVIVDTGPILGSLEAPLICAEADGVVLALGRGQQRTQTERAVEALASVGANMLGVVFNRARAGDFKRAITSASVRSIPASVEPPGNGHPRGHSTTALGPMASTVASGVRR